MNYGITIYGPLEEDHAARQKLITLVATAFPAEYAQINTLLETLRNFPGFNNVEVAQRSSGDLVVHVYYSPVDVPEDADCVFHAKIAPSGTYD